MANAVPHRCPSCSEDENGRQLDTWAYGRLVFSGETNPTCPNCNGPILPVSAFGGPNRLTPEKSGLYSASVATLLPTAKDRETPNVTPLSRVDAASRDAASVGVSE